jgi:hypothetical protein
MTKINKNCSPYIFKKNLENKSNIKIIGADVAKTAEKSSHAKRNLLIAAIT